MPPGSSNTQPIATDAAPPPPDESGRPAWVLPLAAMLIIQTTAAFFAQAIQAIAPLLAASLSWPPERIGYVASMTALGTVLSLAYGNPIMNRYGPMPVMLGGLVLASASLMVSTSGIWLEVLAASFLIGVGYAPTAPGGSRVLKATTPPERRSLIFSIKQAGTPAGGALAGVTMAPFALAFGWEAALIVGGLVGLAVVYVVARMPLDFAEERSGGNALSFTDVFGWRALAGPIALLFKDAQLLRLTAFASSLAVTQGCLFAFAVTYIVHLGLTVAEAAAAYAVMQVGGVVARIVLGWLADRTGNAMASLLAQSSAAIVAVTAYAMLDPRPSIVLIIALSFLLGFLAASWNGIFLGEVARLSPSHQVIEATSAATLFLFLAYVAGPSVFAGVVAYTGDWRLAFLLVAAQLLLAALALAWSLLRGRMEPAQ